MKRLLLVATTAALTMSMGVSTSLAQEDNLILRPVEIWACQFNDRKDQGDMNDVYDMYSDSIDPGYAAWQLNPYFVGSLIQQFDFIYIGAWADNSVMGADLAGDFAGPGDVEEAWNDAATCAGSMYASVQIQSLPNGDGDGDGGSGGPFVMAIRDCKAAEGVGIGNAVQAIRNFNDYRVESGVTIPTFAWVPIAGGGDADYSFKLAHAFQDAAAWGNARQWSVDNRAFVTRNEMTNGIVSCDEARIYTGRELMNSMN